MESSQSSSSTAIHTKDQKHIKLKDEKDWKEPFYFIQGADIQFGFIESYYNDNKNPNWDKEKELAELCVAKINALTPKPKFFIICGDLCEATPIQNPRMRQEQEKDFYEIFNKIDPAIPLVCVCGNHDIGNTPTKESVNSYRLSFGDDYFSFWVGGVHFIVINSQYYVDSSNVPEIFDEQSKWLDEQLELCEPSHHGPVLFQHIPWFIEDALNEVGGYFSIKDTVRKPMLEKLYNAGVRYIFNGHNHRNYVAFYKDLESVTTSAIGGQLGEDQPGIRIVKVLDDKISHQYYDLENIPTAIDI